MNAEFAAWVGIDWADQKHDLALLAAGSAKEEHCQIEQTPEAIDAWATELRRRFGGKPVAVCLEQSKGSLIYALMKYEFLVLYPINPKQLARFREALAPSGSKDDPTDASWALRLLISHRDQLRAWRPDDSATRLIRLLVEDRRSLVEQRTRLCNQLQDRLKQVFPLALEVLGSLTTDVAAEFLLRYSSFQELRQAPPAEVAALYRRHGLGQAKIEERLQRIASATPLTTDVPLVESARLLIRSLATQLSALAEPLREYDRQLAAQMRKHPDATIFESFPGAGDALAPRLLAAFGADRERLQNAAQMQDLSGISPVTRRSGRMKSVLRRWACNKFLRQPFTSSPSTLSRGPSGLRPTTKCCASAGRNTTPRCEPWLSNGSASSSAAGKIALLTTTSSTAENLCSEAPRSSPTSPLPPKNKTQPLNPLDGPAQMSAVRRAAGVGDPRRTGGPRPA
jgi:transposase